jgi:hypothetical protein
MRVLIVFLFILVLHVDVTYAAGKKTSQKKPLPQVDWYKYRFSAIDTYSTGEPGYCIKSDQSPADLMQAMEYNHLNYKVFEQVVKNGMPVVLDVQKTVVQNIGYDYTSGGTASYYREQILTITDRFSKGSDLCEEIRAKHISGVFEATKLERYK